MPLTFREFVTERCWPGYKPAPGKPAYSKGSCVKEETIDEMDKSQKPPGRYIDDEDAGKKQIHLGPESIIKAKDLKNLDIEANKAFWRAYREKQKKGVTEGTKTQKTFKVVHYSPKTDRNVFKTIKAHSKSAVWDKLKQKGIDVISVEEQGVAEDWQKVNRQDKTDGLSPAAVKAYRRENPGSKLQTAVTEKNPKGKRAKRRLSFCRRMKGMKARLTSAENSRDPDSPINKALRRWNC